MNEIIKEIVSNVEIEGHKVTEEEAKEIEKIAINIIKNKQMTLEQFSDLIESLKEDETLLLSLYEYSNKTKKKGSKRKYGK